MRRLRLTAIFTVTFVLYSSRKTLNSIFQLVHRQRNNIPIYHRGALKMQLSEKLIRRAQHTYIYRELTRHTNINRLCALNLFQICRADWNVSEIGHKHKRMRSQFRIH